MEEQRYDPVEVIHIRGYLENQKRKYEERLKYTVNVSDRTFFQGMLLGIERTLKFIETGIPPQN